MTENQPKKDEPDEETQADFYKRNRVGNTHEALALYSRFGNLNPDGWIYFKDGSKYNMENGQTLNPNDIVI